MWKTFETVLGRVNHADKKAEVVLAATGVYVGYISSKIENIAAFIKTSPVFELLALIAFAFLSTSCFFSFRCIIPRPKVKGDNSIMCFSRIPKQSLANFERMVNEELLKNQDLDYDLIQQIWSGSKVVAKKYRDMALSIWCMIGTVVFSLILLITYVITKLNQ